MIRQWLLLGMLVAPSVMLMGITLWRISFARAVPSPTAAARA